MIIMINRYHVALMCTCFHCTQEVEDELHILTRCPLYDDLRDELFEHCNTISNMDFDLVNDCDKLYFILSDMSIVFQSATILHHILMRRRKLLYL